MTKLRLGLSVSGLFLILALILPAMTPVVAQTQPSANVSLRPDTLDITPTPTIAASFASKVRTIWQAEPQLDQQTGECSGVPVNYCSQLVALTPRGRNMYWKGQELRPYLMYRNSKNPNVYFYSGRNSLGDGTVKITLVLTSPTTFKATQVLKLRKEPTCTHTMQFTGTFLR